MLQRSQLRLSHLTRPVRTVQWVSPASTRATGRGQWSLELDQFSCPQPSQIAIFLLGPGNGERHIQDGIKKQYANKFILIIILKMTIEVRSMVRSEVRLVPRRE